MKKKLTLTENELIGVIKRISEQVNIDDYSKEDFIDVFFQVFRSWISEKLGEDYKKYPLSFLLKKYGQEFVENKELLHRGYREQFDSSYYSLEHFGKELVKKSHYQLPQLYKQEKFTEKYKKAIPHFVKMLELPSFINVSFLENEPNRVFLNFDVNFHEWMKYPQNKHINEYNILKKLKKIFGDFGGVDFGNPAHGEVQMEYSSIKDMNVDKWVKNELNKVIKKAIREIDGSKNLHSIRFKPSNDGGKIELVYKDRYNFGYNNKSEFTRKAREIVSSLGYGPNLKVDSV
jgi:hypothetical protein